MPPGRPIILLKSSYKPFNKVVELQLVAYESGRKESFDCMNAC